MHVMQQPADAAWVATSLAKKHFTDPPFDGGSLAVQVSL